MSTFEKQSAGTAYDDRDSHRERARDDHDSHQQHADLTMAGNMMSTWTVAIYDYAEQMLKAQRQFAHSMLGATAPMLDVARDIASPNANEARSANNQLDSRSDQRHDDSDGSRKNERYNDENDAEYNNRFVDTNRSDNNTSEASTTGTLVCATCGDAVSGRKSTRSQPANSA